VQKSVLLAAIQAEIQRHDFSHFIDEPPSIAEGGKGVVVPGRPACKTRINTMSQFLDHLTNDAMPRAARAAFETIDIAGTCPAAISVGIRDYTCCLPGSSVESRILHKRFSRSQTTEFSVSIRKAASTSLRMARLPFSLSYVNSYPNFRAIWETAVS
jgi:hypothetical protein